MHLILNVKSLIPLISRGEKWSGSKSAVRDFSREQILWTCASSFPDEQLQGMNKRAETTSYASNPITHLITKMQLFPRKDEQLKEEGGMGLE